MLCDNLEGWDGGGMGVGGRSKRQENYVYSWLIYTVVEQNPIPHCKALILHLKINKKGANIKEDRFAMLSFS